MSTSNLFKPGGLVWRPDANDVNAPEGTLLRADNMVPDEDGALTVRRGSRQLYAFPDGTEDVHSLYTYEGSSGYTYRLMGADDQVYKNPGPGNHVAHWEVRIAEADGLTVLTQMNYTGGSWEKDYASTGDVGPVTYTATWESDYISDLITNQEPVNFNVTFAGSGDIAMGDDHLQSFMARSTTKKKFDGKSFLNWGIAKPSAAPTLTAVVPDSETMVSFASSESPALTYSDAGTSAFVDGYEGTSNAALQVTPSTLNGATYINIYKTWGTDQNFLNVDGTDGSDQDVIDILVKMESPDRVKWIAINILCGDDADNLGEVGYGFQFRPKDGDTVAIKDPKIEGSNAYEAKVESSLDPVEPKDKPRATTPEGVKQIVAAVGESAGPAGTTGVPPADQWVHLSVTRGQFTRYGNATGRDWATVRRISLQVRNDDGYFGATTLQNLVVYSAGTGTLTGKFQVVYRWVRETDRYYELSPPSEPSDPILLYANQLQVTIPGAAQNAADDQVTTAWVHLFGGFLDTYYRAATATADPQLATDLDVVVDKNEIQILTENEVLEPYTDEPLDNIIAIAGPWNSRLFTLTSEGYVYPSLQTAPNLFNTFQVIDLSRLGDPLWLVKTSSGIHAGCERDVVFLSGTGDESADRVVIDLYPLPLNIGTPPVERGCVFVDGNTILYRSTDGMIMLAAQGLQHVPDAGTRLLWRGQDRHGVSALNVGTGRFRVTVDNKIMYLLAPEGTTTEGTQTIYRLDIEKGQWSRLVFDEYFLSLFNEPDGTLIAGDNAGSLVELEYGTGDQLSDPTVTILTPFMDGGNPLVRKDPFDLQLHTDTNGNDATVSVYKDGSGTAAGTYTANTTQPQVWRAQAEDVGAFVKGQMKVTGDFDEFVLSALNLSYRVRPQHMTYLDTGYFMGDDPRDLVWLQEVEVDANSPSDLSVLVYLDDVLYTTQSVSVTANVRTVYRVPLPRGTKGRRPRIVVKTTASDGAGEIGFDPYFVRVRARSSGNQSGNRFRTVWPVGSAP